MKTFLKRLILNNTPKTSSFMLRTNKFYFSENQVKDTQTPSTENNKPSNQENPNQNKEKKHAKKQQQEKNKNPEQKQENVSSEININQIKEEKTINTETQPITNQTQQEFNTDSKKEDTTKKVKQDMKAEGKKERAPPKEEIKPSGPIISEKFKKAFEEFKKNWKNIAIENEDLKLQEMQKEMSASQLEYLQLLGNKFTGFNSYQIKYFNYMLKDKVMQKTGLSSLEIHSDFNSIYKSETIQSVNPGYFRQQEQMSEFTKWLRTKAEPGLAVQQEAPKEEVKEEKKEEKKEVYITLIKKEVYDIELSSFDAAKKIVLIKEVRAALNLGLKEAKELVERAPVVVFKAVKKAECEAKMAKLKENGGVLKLI